MSEIKNVLILGCGRSGTSIFGELFKHISDYQYYSEPPFAFLKELDYTKPLAVKVPKESPEYPPTKGLSFPLDNFFVTVPGDTQVYWQVRHPLDTICSLRVGISRNWGHHPRPEDWQDWLSRPLVEQCAHHWDYINSVSFEQVKDIAKISRFEDMIADASGFAHSICKENGVDIQKHEAELNAWAQRVQDSNNKNFVEAETSRAYSTKDHKVRVGRWKENLTEDELDLIKPIIENSAARMGYELP